MVIASQDKLEIGEIVALDIRDEHDVLHEKQPCFVLRESTVEEWHREVDAEGVVPVRMQHQKYFYDISTD